MTTFLPRKVVNPNILLLDGISRSGKFLMGKVISHFERVEYFRYIPLLEIIPIFLRLGHFSQDATKLLFQIAMDIAVYEGSIGRNMNTRPEDATAIHKAPDFERYLKRMADARGDEAANEIIKEGRYPSFLIHEGLPHIELFFKAFPQLKLINIQRHPVDLVHSWIQVEMAPKLGGDPLLYYPVIEGADKTAIPWWVHPEDTARYPALNDTEKALLSVLRLQGHEQTAYKKLNVEQRKSILLFAQNQQTHRRYGGSELG